MEEVEVAVLVSVADKVYSELGSGMSEANYHNALEVEMNISGMNFLSEPRLSISYRGFEVGYDKPDFVVFTQSDVVVVELKADKDPSYAASQIEMYRESYSDSMSVYPLGVVICFNEDGVNWCPHIE